MSPRRQRRIDASRTTASAPVLIGGSVVGLGLGIWLLGIVWPSSDSADISITLGGLIGGISGLLGAAAMAGSQILTAGSRLRRLSPLIGVLFGVGFSATVRGLIGFDDGPWLLIGITGLGLSVIWFYMVGMIGGGVPDMYVNEFGTWTAPVIGVVLIIVGVVNGTFEVVLIGALTIGAWAGLFIGSVVLRRRDAEVEPAESE